ncbi:protein FAM81A-like [Mizuhopecten yessoensis]|uniref:Protein FAM81B n=1 Tax=Mizuhopecten yessoensis TaxID=6573 RepID=A0A210QG42_MIZYE|nr:protein FAM81A-like [Mizuhopecten yessoensis]OWF47733.1 Protein FAM81B [Mizuhopecten yessoensis]
MARRGGTLPALRAPYAATESQEYGITYRNSPRPEEIVPRESRGPSRLDILEERLAQQERNTQTLIDRAFKIKEDVIDSLNFTHGTWQEEKHARSMLQEHIRTITAIVNKLNTDIAMVDDQLRHRDNATVGTNNAVKNLEVHHVASLTDLRGRIVRCDTSIAKLSTDLRQSQEAMKQLGNFSADGNNKVLDRVHQLESREKVERRMDENHYVTDARLAKLEEGLHEERARITDLQHQLESKLMLKLDNHIKTNAEEFGRLKRETREGFSTVHESISNMKTVMEGKRKLLEDQLRKEIGQIRKMVVLV